MSLTCACFSAGVDLCVSGHLHWSWVNFWQKRRALSPLVRTNGTADDASGKSKLTKLKAPLLAIRPRVTGE